jgi:hypothetical protein
MKNYCRLALIAVTLGFYACQGNEDEIDTQAPIINMAFDEAFPQQCEVLQRGETYTIETLFTDNFELGSYSLDIHHNFDHHTHSTDVTECERQPIKEAVNPWLIIEGHEIPSGQKSHRISLPLSVPTDVDTGDYHLMIKLTDKEGWQTIKGIWIIVQ